MAERGVGVARSPVLEPYRPGLGACVEACFAPAAVAVDLRPPKGCSGLVRVSGMAPLSLWQRAELAWLWGRASAGSIRRATGAAALRELGDDAGEVVLVHVTPGGAGAGWKTSPLLGSAVAAAVASLLTGLPARADAAVAGELVCPSGTLGGYAFVGASNQGPQQQEEDGAAGSRAREHLRELRHRQGLWRLVVAGGSVAALTPPPASSAPAAAGEQAQQDELSEVLGASSVQEALPYLLHLPAPPSALPHPEQPRQETGRCVSEAASALVGLGRVGLP